MVFAKSPGEMVATTGFNAEADRRGFLVAYLVIPRNSNDLSRQTGGSGELYPDLQFVHRTLAELRASENVDPSRVYITGLSAGGVLSYRAACLLSEDFAAVGVVEAFEALPGCAPKRPVSMFVVYGASDTSLSSDVVRSNIAHWRRVDGCPEAAVTAARGSATVETWAPCRLGTAVALATVSGQGHGWSQSPRFAATQELWAFFSAHRAPGAAPAGAVLSVRVATSPASRRVLVRIRADGRLAVRLRLLRQAKRIASASFDVRPGVRVLALRVPASTASGACRLQIVLRSVPGGGLRTIVRSLRLPRGG